jgi:hypothetical protein
MFVACINNSLLGSCFPVNSTDEGISHIKRLAKLRLDRELTPDEIAEIENDLSILNDSDPDNVWSYSLGMVNDE